LNELAKELSRAEFAWKWLYYIIER
jgi:hypothetical protein